MQDQIKDFMKPQSEGMERVNNAYGKHYGKGVEYYRRHIPPAQFRLLTIFLSYAVPGDSHPDEIFYPEDL